MSLEKVKYMIMAQDMKRAVGFYKSAIGLRVDFQSPDWTELNFGDAIVALHGGWQGGVNKTGLSFQVKNIQEACDNAVKNGGKVIAPPEDRTGEPIFLATLRDTEGNEFMISQMKGVA